MELADFLIVGSVTAIVMGDKREVA